MEMKNINIVYYGPGISGKTQNLIFLHKTLNVKRKGELTSQMINELDRLASFDMTLSQETNVHLQCLCGGVYYPKSRQDVLSNAHAVVFVANSFGARLQANKEILTEFAHYLTTQKTSLERFPWVIQYTFRDMPRGILSIQELESQLNEFHVPYFKTNPPEGIGVLETFKTILRKIGITDDDIDVCGQPERNKNQI